MPQGSATITHSTSLDMQDGRGPACRPYFDDSTADAEYLRTFTLTDFGITGAFTVTAVTFGVELATYPFNSPPVILYTLDGDLTYDNVTLIGSAFSNFGPGQSQLVTVPVTGTAPAGSTLVVEIAARDLISRGSSYLGRTTWVRRRRRTSPPSTVAFSIRSHSRTPAFRIRIS